VDGGAGIRVRHGRGRATVVGIRPQTPDEETPLELSAIPWLALGFSLGLVHAFDADHVMALSVFATRESGPGRAIAAGIRWAAGHGCVLLLAGIALLALGRALPPEVSLWAERVVGLTMIGLGIHVWIDLLRSRAHIHFHVHDDLPPHAHWHRHEEAASNGVGRPGGSGHQHRHGPVMVGALHGLAGSTPLLAVVGVGSISPALGLAYLLLFALGVTLAMALVSGLLGQLASRMAQGARDGRPTRKLTALRALSAVGSMTAGGWLVVVA